LSKRLIIYTRQHFAATTPPDRATCINSYDLGEAATDADAWGNASAGAWKAREDAACPRGGHGRLAPPRPHSRTWLLKACFVNRKILSNLNQSVRLVYFKIKGRFVSDKISLSVLDESSLNLLACLVKFIAEIDSECNNLMQLLMKYQ